MSLHGSMFMPPYRQLALFAGNLAFGIESARSLPRAFSIALRSLHHTRVGRSLHDPVETVRAGATIADTLKQADKFLPPFVIPTIQAGEETGRLEESLRFLEHHCRLLSGPALIIRNAWLVPLVILFIGDLAAVVLSLAIGAIPLAAQLLVSSTIKWVLVSGLIWCVHRPVVKPYFDRIRLSLPWYGGLAKDIASHRYFRVLGLLYGISNAPVDRMLDTAAASISNRVAQAEFRKPAEGVRAKETIAESFQRASGLLDEEQQTSIAAGEQGGKLEKVFNQLADDSGNQLQRKLKLLEQFTYRLATLIVVSTIISVAWRLSSL